MEPADRPASVLPGLDRRTLLKGLAAAGVGLALPRTSFATTPQDSRPMPKDKLKILILGGTAFLGFLERSVH